MDDYEGFWSWGYGDGAEGLFGNGYGSGSLYWQGDGEGNGKGTGTFYTDERVRMILRESENGVREYREG